MTTHVLPEGPHPAPPPVPAPHFPTRQQAVVWRNWELVPVSHLARVLGTHEAQVLDLARGLGLRVPPLIQGEWIERGYNTIIRANWHLLPYEQLLTLLGWTAERLAFTLKEDDFLWIKLGQLKPDTPPVRYAPLTDAEQAETERLRTCLRRHFPDIDTPEPAPPFAFLHGLEKPEPVTGRPWGAPRHSYEITLDDSWKIGGVPDDPAARQFLGRFVRTHEARWGVRLRADPASQDHAIELVLDRVGDEPAESHTIEVSADRVRLSAPDAVGLLRALQGLEVAMEHRGAPHLVVGTIRRRTRFDLRLIYPYATLYGDPLFGHGDPCPPGLLSRFAGAGINGIWLQGILYTLYPWRYVPDLSAGCDERLATLQRLARHAAEYGIGVYLYLNEPRGLPLAFFRRHPEYKGIEVPTREMATLCTSRPEVLRFLRDSTEWVFRQVPDLAGVFTITMSENPTNCWSVGGEQCPRCSQRPPAEVIAEVNGTIEAGVHAARPDARVIVWTWGWNADWTAEAIDRLPAGVEVMCTSEEALPTRVGGVEQVVWDYSISQVGPGDRARSVWARARAHGLKTLAKVQLNNSWECSAVPYIPAPDLAVEHLRRLAAADVTGLMVSWTLGGYPSPILDLAAESYWQAEGASGTSIQGYAERVFGKAAGRGIANAWTVLSRAFPEFPFNVGVLYAAPQNSGPMNLLYAEPTGYKATMVGFPYDHADAWRGVYPPEVFEDQMRRLSLGWHGGLASLEGVRPLVPENRRAAFEDLENATRATYAHFRSAYLQTVFVRLRDRLASAAGDSAPALRHEILAVLDEEIMLARMLHDLVRRDSRIGFEPTQHYYYTLQSLREKAVSCEDLKTIFVVPPAG